MENFGTLSFLVNDLNEYKSALEAQWRALQAQEATMRSKADAIKVDAEEKARQFASITEDSIMKYKLFCQGLSSNETPPCPICFMSKHSQYFPLKGIRGDKYTEPLYCDECQQTFNIPMP